MKETNAVVEYVYRGQVRDDTEVCLLFVSSFAVPISEESNYETKETFVEISVVMAARVALGVLGLLTFGYATKQAVF